MSEINWVIVLLTSSLFKLIEVNCKEDRALTRAYLVCMIVSTLVLGAFVLHPQKYDKVETKTVNVVKGDGPPTHITKTRKLEATDYLWGLIKDSNAEWIDD